MIYRGILANAQDGHAVIQRAWAAAKPWLIAEHRLVVKIEPETRSGSQNAMLHALISDIAQRCEWAGRKWDAETWKRLLVASWCRTSGHDVMFVPALDGRGVDMVPRRTSSLTKGECADLLDFVQAWAVENMPQEVEA